MKLVIGFLVYEVTGILVWLAMSVALAIKLARCLPKDKADETIEAVYSATEVVRQDPSLWFVAVARTFLLWPIELPASFARYEEIIDSQK